MPHEHLLTVSHPSLDSLQPGAQGRHSQERGAALMTSKFSAACQHHIASLRCHRRDPRQTFPWPGAHLVSKEHVIDDVIIDHRGLVHQRGDLPAGPALLNPFEQEDEPIHGAAERERAAAAALCTIYTSGAALPSSRNILFHRQIKERGEKLNNQCHLSGSPAIPATSPQNDTTEDTPVLMLQVQQTVKLENFGD